MIERLKSYLEKTNPVSIFLSNGVQIFAITLEEELGDFIKITGRYIEKETEKLTDFSELIININQISFIHLDSREKF